MQPIHLFLKLFFREYVKSAFDSCKNDTEKDKLEQHFKGFLKKLLDDGTAYVMDWKNYPMPK